MKKSPKSTTTKPAAPPAPAKPEVISISNIEELSATIQKPYKLHIEYGTEAKFKTYEFTIQPLTPAQDAAIEDHMNSVLPKMIHGKTPEDDRPDYNNPEYQKARLKAEYEAMAYGIYLAVPAFQTGGPGLKNIGEISSYVLAKVDMGILKALWSAIRRGGVLGAAVNFS